MSEIRRIVIAGGGAAGWMTAAALASALGTERYDIVLVESEAIGTVGVGEATIPMIRLFNRLLKIDEDAFIRATQATFKLGIEFVDWRRRGLSYFHPFGHYGADMEGVPFQHFWLRWRAAGGQGEHDLFNAETLAARQGRFQRVGADPTGRLPPVNYAYQFDATLYAGFLRDFAEARGVSRREGRIVAVRRDGLSGDISALAMEDGRLVEGDFFVDCTGFRALLIGETLGADYEDWTRWLPTDRAVAAPSARSGPPAPYTQAVACEAGWRWRIPLQHRTGNGYVFSSAFLSEDEACARLVDSVDGELLAEPRTLRFRAGRRTRCWDRNVVALGLSAGFLEPLESTSIHLIQAGIAKLLAHFPTGRRHPVLAAKFSREMVEEYDSVRDFLIAHYVLTERDDTPFWRQCRAMDIPASLAERLALFRARGEVLPRPLELFKETNWFAVLTGMGLEPRGHHPVADRRDPADLDWVMARVRQATSERASGMADHARYLSDAGLVARS